jgi:hypothetical protein
MPGECVRVATVTIQGAHPNPQRDLDRGNSVWLTECSSWIDVVGSVTVDRPDLLILDQDDCLGNGHVVSDEEDQLFDLGRDLGADVVCYYIEGDTAGFRGCAAHPPGRRGFWVGDSATEWTFVHELTHVIGDNPHVSDSENLLYEGGTASITDLPPDLTSDQCSRIEGDAATGPCVLAVEGKLTFLRVHDVGTAFGPSGDEIDVEVVARLDTEPNRAFGFQLRTDADEACRQGMLDLLRTAFNTTRRVRIDYLRTGIRNGIMLRAMIL